MPFTPTRRTMLLAAASTLGLAACGSQQEAGSEGSSGGSAGALAMGFAGNDITIWNDQIKMMQPLIEQAGYKFLTDDPQWDVQRQVADWDAWVQRGDVKAIMGFPVQSDAMVPVTQRATAAGITVLGYAVKWPGVKYGTVIDAKKDGELLGAAAGEWVTQKYAGQSSVPVALIADKTSDLGKGRTEGIVEALTAAAPNTKISVLPGISREEGNANAKSQLIADPNTRIWLGTSNDNTAGAYQALLDSGVAADDSRYLVGSLDATNDTLDIIKQPGSIWACGFILPAKALAESNAQLLIAAAKGEQLKDNVLTSTRITADNVDSFYVR